MKPKYVKREIKDAIKTEYFEEKGMPSYFAEMLAARDFTPDDYEVCFNNKTCFHSPFDMQNMSEAVETISYVMESDGSVLIYGDYDADGLTASSILSLFFTDNGIENTVVIPNRDEGYGLHADKILRAFERNYYDLIITVDCGISNADEIAKIINELDVEVIVTDHHELPDVLPDCICVNPKLGYTFPYLSGAGVAWKLVEALSSRENALKYSSLAAIGTIGDIMPMQDENRSIVKAGILNWNHKNLNKLSEMSYCGKTVTCSDIAMKIVPKINAAGRVGFPEIALEFLLGRDNVDLKICEKLAELNDIRKKNLDEIIIDADKICDNKTIYKEKLVFLQSDYWQHGLLGIVAARYKERFGVPSFVMSKDGDDYIGSGRGIDKIDLFDVISKCKDCLVKFGGHKASVGFTVKGDRIDEFHNALVSALQYYENDCFDKTLYYDIDLEKKINVSDILSFTESMQPLLPQDKIVCRIKGEIKFANAFGKDNSHLSAVLDNGLELKGFFKFGKYAPFIKNGAKVDLLCSLEIDNYSKSVCGIIEDLSLQNSVCFDDFYQQNLFKNFVTDKVETLNLSELTEILNSDSVVAVFDDYETYLKYCDKADLKDFGVDIFFNSSVSNKTVAVSPLETYDYDKFEHIVYFCNEAKHRKLPPQTVYVSADYANENIYNLSVTREHCLKVFKALKNKNKFDSVNGVYEKYLLGSVTYSQFIVALRVFRELGLINIADKYTVEFPSNRKSDLMDSSIFRSFNKM